MKVIISAFYVFLRAYMYSVLSRQFTNRRLNVVEEQVPLDASKVNTHNSIVKYTYLNLHLLLTICEN
jgi:IMP cyclohydrolase